MSVNKGKANGVVNKDKGNKHQKSNKANSANTNKVKIAKEALNGLATILNTGWIALLSAMAAKMMKKQCAGQRPTSLDPYLITRDAGIDSGHQEQKPHQKHCDNSW